MHCYRHNDRDAVAVCCHCGKAACANCCEDTGQGIACNSDCAAELQETYRLTTRLKQSFGIGRKPPMPASVSMYLFFGLILLAVAVYLTFSRQELDYLTFAMAAVFFVMSWLSYKRFRDACLTC
jgi:hypothetical protein